MVWPVGGGSAKTFGYAITAGQTGQNINWGEFTVATLTSGQNYNVTVTVDATDGTATYHLTTDPAQAKAK
jgi:VCBS repeat-containing protein